MPKMSDLKKKDTAVYCYGSYGHGNMGDELIASGLANVVKSIFDYHSTLIVDNESKYHRANASHRTMWDEIVDPAKGRRGIVREVSLMIWLFFHLKKGDVFILGGGGLLNDCHTYNMPHFFLLLLMARLKTSEVFLLGISVGPLNGRVGRTLFSLLMKLIKVAYMRDVTSLLAAQKVCGAPVEICRDLAWFAGYFNGTNTNPLGAVSKEIVCGINVIPYFHHNHWFEVDQDVYESYLLFMTEVIALLRREGVKLVLFSVDCNRYPVAMDDLISRAGAVEFFSVPKSPSQLIATVQRCDFIIGSRLHSIVTAHRLGVPALALPYQGKVAAYCEDNQITMTALLNSVLNCSVEISQALETVKRFVLSPKKGKNCLDKNVEEEFSFLSEQRS